jgi:hypothetical protein
LGEVEKRLQKLSQGQKPRSGEQANKMHELAQKVMKESTTPEEREQLERELRGMGNQGNDSEAGAGPGTESAPHQARAPSAARQGPSVPVDVRRKADQPKERTLAEWYSNEKPERGAVGDGGVAGAMREAAQGAERAVEQQEVPARYSDLVRRVFKRYAEGAEKK